MTRSGSESTHQRRRGPELESALLDATWEELAAVGFANLTMESVARRARTGIAVLYRRWANKDELVLAAIEHYRRVHPVEVADTGTLRGDLLEVLTAMSSARFAFIAIAVAAGYSGLIADTGLTPGEVRDRIFDERSSLPARFVYQRAQDRGEIDLARLPAALLAMPFDLVRHDLLMQLKPLDEARIRSIVDDLFLPLVQSYRAGQASAPPRSAHQGTENAPVSGRPGRAAGMPEDGRGGPGSPRDE